MAGLQDYKRLQKLGVGSFASAHLMQHKVTGKKSVLKRIACKHLKAANAALLEVKVLLSCNHVNITAYHDFFLDSDSEENIVICLLMEYCSGGDLWERIAAAQRERKVLPAAQSAGWLLQIIAALRYLHSCGIMHRDVKPENIFITEEARTERAALAQCTTAYAHITHLEWAWHALRTCMTRASHVHGVCTECAWYVPGVLEHRFHASLRDPKQDAVVKLGDFGLAKDGTEGPSNATTQCGTPDYMAPEVLEGRPYEAAADIFSLGAVLYALPNPTLNPNPSHNPSHTPTPNPNPDPSPNPSPD